MALSCPSHSCRVKKLKADRMSNPGISTRDIHPDKRSPARNRLLLALSIMVQILLGLYFGHVYDMRIFMATGYLVGTGQNPYIPQDLSAVFHNPTFQAITTVGYPPPWPLVLGGIYRVVYSIAPNLLVYNGVIKLPLIV